MPKAAPPAKESAGGSAPMPPVLKRNQACHQCRRRKLKCDANRPCATCVRSHRNAVNHAAPGTEVPPLECTFDDVAENGADAPHPVPKTRLEKLENRINELESLLQEKDRALQGISGGTTASQRPHLNGTNGLYGSHNGSELTLLTDQGALLRQQGNGFSTSPMIAAHISPIHSPPNDTGTIGASPPLAGSNFATQLTWSTWPKDLPNPELLQHLVDVFFSFHHHSNRIFHAPTFLTSMTLPPNHPGFPHIAILHAICAVGSFYTAAVRQADPPNFAHTPADDLFQNAYKRRYALEDSFGEKHAKLTMAAIEDSTSLGERLFECQQATTVLTWFYHGHAKWSDMFLTIGRAMRYSVPIGLNMCPPFHSISKSLRAPSIIPPARTVIEDETRRNTFWITYATERLYSSGNGWALSMDDQDISQLLPVRGDQFENGTLVPPKHRQWAHSPEMLLSHNPEQTDSFILYIKSSIVMSRVKCFNLRFRALNFAGDPKFTVPGMGADRSAQYIDPRATEGFKEVDCLVNSFVDSFPRHLKDPVQGGVVDPHLLLACLAPNVAKILLHDPHADLCRDACISKARILEAAHTMLNWLYAILATSYDITLLDNFAVFAFFMTGRVLVRFVQNSKESGDESQFLTFRTELEFIRIAMARIGQRLPLAFRYAKMLDDIIYQVVGVLDDLNIPNFSIPGNPLQLESDPSLNASQLGMGLSVGPL
ncbi:hypothetical protein SCHPADRAFT_920667 [Schizopora paradoxa]|uniref:Zn(2)-C6 fungal-type domain-containing protein n=1 Tax=Schizopora paradoxa TaxID=27342 RepID=A0A0H2RYC1_9AGAM|nr:hypothetical protein SCHPADRAFT_920667 [Schizopora paradoxa]